MNVATRGNPVGAGARSLGVGLRALRERAGLSLEAMARQADLSPGYLSRLEHGAKVPSLATRERLAAVVGCQPVVTFMPAATTLATLAADLAGLSPLQRLESQPIQAFDVILAFETLAPGFAVTGLAAALLQGVAARVECLDILVLDRDDILLTLSDVMQRAMVIFSPKSPDELRRVVNRSWGFIGCDVTITLVPELPATVVRRRSVGRRSGRCRAWSRT